jgi:hypothetical protein
MKPLGRIATGYATNRLFLDRKTDTENFKPGRFVRFAAYERPEASELRVGGGRIHAVDHAQGSIILDDASGFAWNTACPALLDGDWIFEEPKVQRPTFNHTRADGPFEPCVECLQRMTREQLIALVLDMRETRHDAR